MQLKKPDIEYILNEHSFCNQFSTWRKIAGEQLFFIDPKGDYHNWKWLESYKKSVTDHESIDFNMSNYWTQPKIDFSARDYLIDQTIIELIMFNKDLIKQKRLDLNQLENALINEKELFHEIINKIFADIYISSGDLDKVIKNRSEYIINNALRNDILWAKIEKEYEVFNLEEELSNDLNDKVELKKSFKI